jgi:hypothetical protein
MTPSEDVVLMRNEYVPSPLIALKRSNSTKVLSATAPREATIVVSATGALLKVIVFSLQELLRTLRIWPPELEGSVANSRSLAPVTVVPAVPETVNLRKIISTGELSAFRPVAVRKLMVGLSRFTTASAVVEKVKVAASAGPAIRDIVAATRKKTDAKEIHRRPKEYRLDRCLLVPFLPKVKPGSARIVGLL